MKLRARSIQMSSSGTIVGFGNDPWMINLSALTVRIGHDGNVLAATYNGRILPSTFLPELGDAATRVIAARALGMQFAQLPPFEFDL